MDEFGNSLLGDSPDTGRLCLGDPIVNIIV